MNRAGRLAAGFREAAPAASSGGRPGPSLCDAAVGALAFPLFAAPALGPAVGRALRIRWDFFMDRELNEHYSRVADRVSAAHAYLHIDERTKELEELNGQIAAPEFWNDPAHAQSVSKQAGALRDAIAVYDDAVSRLEDAKTALELAEEDESFAQEAASALDALDKTLDGLEVESWFSGQFDGGDAILTVNPGQGGLEAQDWTEMLYHMYSRYAEKRGWKVTVLDVVPGEAIGLDRATIQIEGRNAYGMLRSEIGVHRLVRISPTDDKKRRHTTFASVEVLPVLPDDIEVDLNPADVRVDVYRAGGPGGQCVNTTDSAVRLTHIPTGIVVTCQDRKSQLQNKESAFQVLKARLYALEEQKRAEEIDELRGERRETTFGSQIRNYVLYPYQLVKDLRSGVETGNVDAVLDGDLDDFVIGYHRWRVSQ